jgi:hypothetical protein
MQGKKMGVRPAVAWWARRIAGRIVRERALFANTSSHCQAPSHYRSQPSSLGDSGLNVDALHN